MNYDAIAAGPVLDSLIHDALGLKEPPRAFFFSGKLPVPCYSTEIAETWIITDRFKRSFRLHRELNHKEWYCEVWDGIGWIHAEGDTAPLAICRAFMKSLQFQHIK